MKVVGLTGGIASGKSTISEYLQKLGAVIIDADKISREVVNPGERAWQKIKEFFGNDVFNPDETLNRKAVASIVFNNNEAREVLNNIIHPEVIEKTKEMIKKYKGQSAVPLIVVDAPLLIEAGMQTIVDEVWVLDVDRETQIQRVMDRDNVPREAVVSRLNSQMPTAEKKKYADKIIYSNLSLEKTLQQVYDFWQEAIQ